VKIHKINALTNNLGGLVRIIGEKGGKMKMKKTFKNLLLVFLLILGGVTLLACGGTKALAKEEDAYMIQAVSAANMSASAATLQAAPNVSLDSSGKGIDASLRTSIESNLAEKVTQLIDEQLKMLETFLENVEIKHSDSDRDGFEKMASYTSTDLEGNTVKYVLYYNVIEHEVEDDEIETEFKGLLVITMGDSVREVPIDGEVEIENGEKEVKVVHEANGVKVEVKSKVQAGEREFEYKVQNDHGLDHEFKLKIKNEKGKMVLEIETEVGNSEVKIKLQTRTQTRDRKHIDVDLELEDFDVVVGTLDSDLEAELIIDSSGEEVVCTYKFEGKFKFKSRLTGVEQESEFNFQHEYRHQKGKNNQQGNPNNTNDEPAN
jgi:hypothetical protein